MSDSGAMPYQLYMLKLTDCIYGFSNCGLSYEEAKYCLCHVAPV